MLKKRLLSALLLITIVLAVIFSSSNIAVFTAVGLLTVAASMEWASLANLKSKLSHIVFAVFNLVLLALLTFISFELVMLLAVLHWIIAFGFVVRFPNKKQSWENNLSLKLMWGVWTIVPCSLALLALYGTFGPWMVLIALALVWLADSAAFFVGRKYGSKALAISVSPKKSWQGFYGALTAVFIYSLTLTLILQLPMLKALWFIVICMISCLFAVLGDLFESMLKRVRGIKDSGNLIPGHGGILDRIDGVTAAMPIFSYGVLSIL